MQDDTRPTSSSATLDDHVIAGDLRSCALCGHAGTFHDADAPFSDGTVCMIVRCRCSKFIPPEASGVRSMSAIATRTHYIDNGVGRMPSENTPAQFDAYLDQLSAQEQDAAIAFDEREAEDAAIDDESWTREDQDAEDGDRAADAMMENSSATWL